MNKSAWTTADSYAVLKTILGGTILGGSAAAGTSLLNHINSMKEDRKRKEAEDVGAPELFVPGPGGIKAATTSPEDTSSRGEASGMALGVGIPLAAVGALGAYGGVKRLYGNYKQQQLKEKLMHAQRAYEQALIDESKMTKAADDNALMTTGRSAPDIPFAKALATASVVFPGLASAFLTYRLLNRHFPDAQTSPSPNSVPMKVTLGAPQGAVKRRVNPDPTTGELVTATKQANYWGPEFASEDEAITAAFPELVETVLGNSKVASCIPDMVVAAGRGFIPGMEDALSTGGIKGLFEFVKGAGANYTDPVEKVAGVARLEASALLSPAFRVLVGQEFVKMAGSFVEAALFLDEDEQKAFLKWGALNGRLMSAQRMERALGVEEECSMEKAAALLTAKMASIVHQELTPADSLLGSGAGHGEESDQSGNTTLNHRIMPNKDSVDSALSAPPTQ